MGRKGQPVHERTEGYIKRWILWLPDERYGYGMLWLHQLTDVQNSKVGHTHSWPFLALVLKGRQEELFSWRSDAYHRQNCRMMRWIEAGEWVCRASDHTHVLDPAGQPGDLPLSLVFTGVKERQWEFVWPNVLHRMDGNTTLRKQNLKHNAEGIEDW